MCHSKESPCLGVSVERPVSHSALTDIQLCLPVEFVAVDGVWQNACKAFCVVSQPILSSSHPRWLSVWQKLGTYALGAPGTNAHMPLS
jgi:hypothetical protein